MLHWFRAKLKILARGTLALAGMLWLTAAAAPCAMAQMPDAGPAHEHCPERAKHQAIGPSVMPGCGHVTAFNNCQLPDSGMPHAPAFGDFSMTQVLLATLPLHAMPADNGRPPRPDFLVPDIPAPPLHIRHLTLIL